MIFTEMTQKKIKQNYKTVYKNSIKYKKELFHQGEILANYKYSTKLNN